MIMEMVLPKDVDKLPFCIQQIIKNKMNVTDADRTHIISIMYRYMKATNIRASVHSEMITCLNKSFQNPLTPEEIKNVLNNILSTGKIIKPTCDEIKSNPSLNHICQNYNTQCPVNRQARVEHIKNEIKTNVTNIIPHTKRVHMLKGSPTYYIIEFNDGNKFQILDELLLKGSQTFRVWYANTYRRVLLISKDEWLEIVQTWLEMAEETEQELLSEDEVIKELVLNKLRNAIHVSSFDEAVKREGRIYIENGKAHIYNTHLTRMIEREGFKVSFHKLRLILYGYLAEQTRVVKIGENSYRFWVFSVQKVGIPVREIISDEEVEPPNEKPDNDDTDMRSEDAQNEKSTDSDVDEQNTSDEEQDKDADTDEHNLHGDGWWDYEDTNF